MKKKCVDLTKMEKIITNDRMRVGSDFKELFMNDFAKLISEYFEVKDAPLIDIVKQGNVLDVLISFSSQGVKQFKISK